MSATSPSAAAHLAAAAEARHARRARAFRIGILSAILSTILGAGQPVAMRFGAVHLDPLLFCSGCVIVAALCSIAWLSISGNLSTIFDPRFRTRLCLMGLSGTVMTSLTVTYGLAKINAVLGVLLLQSEPVYSLVLSTIFVGERPSLRQVAATAVILIGISSVFGGGSLSPWWAAGLVFITPFFWQTSHVIGLKVMPPLSPATVTGARFIYASMFMTALLLVFRAATVPQLANPQMLAVTIFTGVLIYFFGALTWYGAISRLSLAWTTALVVPGIPLLSILFAVIFLGEHATRREVIGILIAISGVLGLVLGAEGHRTHHDEVEIAESIHQPLG
ncbi:MAG TPA: DMT family transporter [Candidatus Binataceae bacterium]|nr:DMT family transporter [Candidatus Binataceae bacterium]